MASPVVSLTSTVYLAGNKKLFVIMVILLHIYVVFK